MKKDDSLYLKHILDSIKQIEEYIAGFDYNKFLQAKLTQDGVIRQLEIIGEATKNISDSLKKDNPAVPWKDIAGMRDKLIHNYFGVDIQAVWETAQDDLPLLQQGLLKILEKLN
jgi:uncharacterized protein with HEPN domain